MRFTLQQDAALMAAKRWIESGGKKQVFCLFGYAGTGKTTLAKHLVESARGTWLFAAYTGKAAHVLRQKGCVGATTIHSLIYRPAGESLKAEIEALEHRITVAENEMESIKYDHEALANSQLQQKLVKLRELRRKLVDDNEPQFSLWINSPLNDPDVAGVVIDEVSMVDKKIARDLESFGKQILVLGDPAQLPPVGGGGYYTERKPDAMLTDVHRHAAESGILRLATLVRNGEPWDGFTSHDVEIVPARGWTSRRDDFSMIPGAFPQILVGLNRTRREQNVATRKYLGFEGGLDLGDRVVCLRNNRQSGVYNGSQWNVVRVTPFPSMMTADMEIVDTENSDERRTLSTWLHHFMGASNDLREMHFYDRGENDEFDYAYAMTVHKAQGSQWETVVLFNEGRYFRNDARRWLYTGITRASERLVMVRSS